MQTISSELIQAICTRLAQNKRVRRVLPVFGRLHIDRQVPFLCVYRRPPGQQDDGTERFVLGEASYLIASGEQNLHRSISLLIAQVVKTLGDISGSFLIVEIWSTPQNERNVKEPHQKQPSFRVISRMSRNDPLTPTIVRMENSLKTISLFDQAAHVTVTTQRKVAPPGLAQLLSEQKLKMLGCRLIGLEVEPVYRHPETHTLFPLVLQSLHDHLARALKKTFFTFARTRTPHRPAHYYALGRRAMVKAVWDVDKQLADISDSFDFLLHVTPTNSEAAWQTFKRNFFQQDPVFTYRPLPIDPILLKRTLYNIRIERVEDPTLSQLFQEKQRELEQHISMLLDRGTKRFLYESLQLFGWVDNALLKTAKDILSHTSPRNREETRDGYLNAQAFAERATAEIAYYRQFYSALSATVSIRDDVNTGLMVSQGHLFIGTQTKVPVSRVEALLHHEIGTHILTYFNGQAQPFRQLYTGLAGYDELQEGLAVLAEYLGGNLSRPRLRVLAARVVAAHAMIEDATFGETFRLLTETYSFDQRTAFTITMRIYRGGGLTKDAVYLRGLIGVLNYLRGGGEIAPLFVGKIATNHIPLIRELQLRKILQPAPLRPRYMDVPATHERLKLLREGLTIFDLIERSKP